MSDVKDFTMQADPNGLVTEIETPENGGRMFIPKDATSFLREALIYCDPETIKVEPNNPRFIAQSGCLINKEGRLIFACRGATIPYGVKEIGDNAFSWENDKTGMELDPLRLPDSVRLIDYRAFAMSSEEPIHVVVPQSVETVGLMAFMMRCGEDGEGLCSVTFLGDPQLATGAFGTKQELSDAAEDVLHKLPGCVYTQPEWMLVRAPRGAKVHDYCERYGLRHEIIGAREILKENEIIFGLRDVVQSQQMLQTARQDPDLLHEVYREISDLVGPRTALELNRYFGGQQISFPLRFFDPDRLRDRIAEEYDGTNVKELAAKYRYSEKTIRRMLREAKQDEQPSALNES